MNEVKTGKAIGWDTIPDDILKETEDISFICALKDIYEEIINSGKFPKHMNQDRLMILIKKP
jgi:hypothetical protein